jgi:hypothetical protein
MPAAPQGFGNNQAVSLPRSVELNRMRDVQLISVQQPFLNRTSPGRPHDLPHTPSRASRSRRDNLGLLVVRPDRAGSGLVATASFAAERR